MDLTAKIAEIEAGLTWHLERHFIAAGDEEISSDPWTRTHSINVPLERHRDIEYLHELAHATLAERHHLLGSAFFAPPGLTPADFAALVNPIRGAADWLADALLMEWAPEAEAAEIEEHATLFDHRTKAPAPDSELIYMGGLMMAQAVYYLGRDLASVPEVYRPAACAFLAFNPLNPTVETKRDLINRLAALTTGRRVRLVKHNGFELWQAAGQPAKKIKK